MFGFSPLYQSLREIKRLNWLLIVSNTRGDWSCCDFLNFEKQESLFKDIFDFSQVCSRSCDDQICVEYALMDVHGCMPHPMNAIIL